MSTSPKFAFAKLLADNNMRQMTPPSSPRTYTELKQASSGIQVDQPQKFGGLKAKTEYSPDKINEMLANYNEIPRTDWMGINIGSHVRYIKKDNKFQPGGFIRTKNTKDGHNYFMLENDKFGSKSRNPEYTSWPMNFDNVIRVYLKNEVVQPSIVQSQPSIAQNYNPQATVDNGFLQKQLDDLEKKYSNMENNYKSLQEKVADLEILLKNVSKYISSKQ